MSADYQLWFNGRLRPHDDCKVHVRSHALQLYESSRSTIGPIAKRLAEMRNNIIGLNTRKLAESQEVTLLADRTVPFDVVKKIMSTSTGEGYGRISLAVLQKASQSSRIE